jgi:hypothetical protein
VPDTRSDPARLRGAATVLAVGFAVAFVTLRSIVPAFSERSFDSDQAVIGLMAKHLSEFTAFPLFFYGQNYMLGVQAWIAVPFFWLGGPTVAMLRLPILLINFAVVSAFIVRFTRMGMRPPLALVATLPLIATTPVLSSALVETIGASIEPFAWVLILWALRHRPGWWGPLFCVGYLHREFVLFAAPALAVTQWRTRDWWSAAQLARAAAGFAAVWVLVDALKRTVNLYGPPGGDHVSTSLSMEVQQMLTWISLDPSPYLARTAQVVTEGIPDLLGARPYQLATFSVLGTGGAGSLLAGAALALALILIVVRAPSLRRQSGVTTTADAFLAYLALIGVQTIFAYGLNSGIPVGEPPILRYLLFTMLLPVALLAWYLRREGRRAVRALVVGCVCLWALANVIDTSRLLRDHVRSPPENPHREIADHLVREGVRYGRAGYWDAYIVTFLSREQVVVASTEKVRISAYQTAVERAPTSVVLWRKPCSHGTPVAAWCVERLE